MNASSIMDSLCDLGLVPYLSFTICKMEMHLPRVGRRMKEDDLEEELCNLWGTVMKSVSLAFIMALPSSPRPMGPWAHHCLPSLTLRLRPLWNEACWEERPWTPSKLE